MFDFKRFGAFPITMAFLSIVITFFLYSVLPRIFDSATILRIGDGVFRTQVIKDSNNSGDILSKISKIESDQAFLIIFNSSDKWKMDTKNMKVPVDIVWLSEDKRVVHIVKDAKPNDPAVTPKVKAKYIIGLSSGMVEKKTILVNHMAVFQIDELISN
jgi:uncharacterized membrane protein (UPF0127 family)